MSTKPASTVLITLGICLLLCQGLFPPLAWVACYYMPREYTSQAAIEVKPLPPPGGADQAEIFRSKAMLFSAIDELGLVDKWSAGHPAKISKVEAFNKLVKMINTRQQRQTDLLVVAVTSADRQEAADLVNTIALIYQNRLRDDQQQITINALAELNAQVEKARQNVETAKAELETIRTRDNIPDPNPDKADAPPVTPPNPEYDAAKKKYIDAKKLLDPAEHRYEAAKMQLLISPTPARIWDRAMPALSLSSPNVPLILMAATALGFLCAIAGVVLIFLGLRMKRREASTSNLKSSV